MMKDHVLNFPTETAAHAALDALGYGGIDPDSNTPYWDQSRMIVDQWVGIPAVMDGDEITKPAQRLPGYWLTIALPEVSGDLTAMPECRFVADRKLSSPGAPSFAYLAPNINAALLAECVVEPQFFGSSY